MCSFLLFCKRIPQLTGIKNYVCDGRLLGTSAGGWAYGSQYHLVHVIWGARSSHSAVSTGAYKGREA